MANDIKPVLISGIQPSGRLHLGNYLGAILNFVALQNSEKYDCYFFVADYHSLTEDFDPHQKKGWILDLVKTYLALGVNPDEPGKKSIIFIQSQVPETTELAWILSTGTPLGELSRMTQFKDKSAKSPKNINVGLFTYPVLMAADILLYDAEAVPVGEDQVQHLELTRTIARKFNSKFGETFKEPKPFHTEAARIMSLDNPEKKMSKSSPSGCLFLDDTPDEVRRKIKTAVTDSGKEIKYDPKKKPAVSNLLLMYGTLEGKSVKEMEKIFQGKTYAEFKNELAERLVELTESIRLAKEKLSDEKVLNFLEEGKKTASERAKKKIKGVKEKLGLAL